MGPPTRCCYFRPSGARKRLGKVAGSAAVLLVLLATTIGRSIHSSSNLPTLLIESSSSSSTSLEEVVATPGTTTLSSRTTNHSWSTSTSSSRSRTNTVTRLPPRTKNVTNSVLFLVMGQALYFPWWHELVLGQISPFVAPAELTLLYGSYNVRIIPSSDHATCDSGVNNHKVSGTHHCYTRFLENTTWTQGRNWLAKEAILLEQQQQSPFDYWIFLDEDVRLECWARWAPESGDNMECWRRLLQYLPKLPRPATMLSVMESRKVKSHVEPNWMATSKPDAMLVAIPRSVVPYLLPYATIPPFHSEWTSQAIVYCLLMTCFPQSVVYAPLMGALNALHRDYTRSNFSVQVIAEDAHFNYQRYLPDLSQSCLAHSDYQRYWNMLGPFSTLEKLAVAMPDPNLPYCSPLVDRYRDWEQSLLKEAGYLR